MADAVTKYIVDEVSGAKFTIEVDGTRDPTGHENTSIVIRDVTVKERLLCPPRSLMPVTWQMLC